MSFNDLDPNRTGLILFDFLNAYFRGANEETQRRMEPVVANCVRLRAAADLVGFRCSTPHKADHRLDGQDAALLYSDADMRLEPWSDPEVDRFDARHTVAANWSGAIIDEIAPANGDYVIPKHQWSSFYQTKLELSLRARSIDTIIVCGGAIEVGIIATCFAARDLDLHQVIVRDACKAQRPAVGDVLMEEVFLRMARSAARTRPSP
jgi:nicotinamidase-related amidase